MDNVSWLGVVVGAFLLYMAWHVWDQNQQAKERAEKKKAQMVEDERQIQIRAATTVEKYRMAYEQRKALVVLPPHNLHIEECSLHPLFPQEN